MILLVFLVMGLFAGTGFVSGQSPPSISNPIFRYYLFEIRFIVTHWIIAAGGLAMLIGYFILVTKFKAGTTKADKIYNGALQAVQVFVLGFLLSALFLFVIAFLELNILAVWFSISPQSLGVNMSQATIVDKLKQFSGPPELLVGDKNRKAELVAIAVASVGKDKIYGNLVLPTFPKWLVLPVKKQAVNMLLIDKTLVIAEVDPFDMQTIDPAMGYLFAKSVFPGRFIKNTPKFSLMSQGEYNKYRKADFEEKLAHVDELIVDVTHNINSISARVETDNEKITAGQKSVKQGYANMESQYYSCLSEKITSTDYCDVQKQKANDKTLEISRELEMWNNNLKTDTRLLEDYKVYESFLLDQKKVGKSLENNVTNERGAFDQPDGIKLTLGETDPRTLADYFETLTHEYLHYASFVSTDKKLSESFFEEGLTEYFARKAVRNSLGVNTNLGYPVIVKIITQMAKSIPESELADIYFSKDQVRLERTLDRVYGDNFYRDNKIIFETLQIATDSRQILPLANRLMANIHGQPLSEEDILSTFSYY